MWKNQVESVKNSCSPPLSRQVVYLLLKLCISTIRVLPVMNRRRSIITYQTTFACWQAHWGAHSVGVTGALGCTFCGCWQVCNKACPPSQGHTEQFHCPARPVPHPTPLSYTWTPQSAVLFCFVTYHFLLQNLGSIVYILAPHILPSVGIT